MKRKAVEDGAVCSPSPSWVITVDESTGDSHENPSGSESTFENIHEGAKVEEVSAGSIPLSSLTLDD